MSSAPALRLERRPQTVGLVGVMLVLGLATSGAYYLSTPAPLPLPGTTVTATVPAGQPVYLGVFDPPDDFDRELEVRGVQVALTSTTEIAVQPLLCRGGSVDVTTAPTALCKDVVDPAGRTIGADDTVMLQLIGSGATIAVVDPVTLSFTEGVRRGTRPAGIGARVRVLPTG